MHTVHFLYSDDVAKANRNDEKLTNNFHELE